MLYGKEEGGGVGDFGILRAYVVVADDTFRGRFESNQNYPPGSSNCRYRRHQFLALSLGRARDGSCLTAPYLSWLAVRRAELLRGGTAGVRAMREDGRRRWWLWFVCNAIDWFGSSACFLHM